MKDNVLKFLPPKPPLSIIGDTYTSFRHSLNTEGIQAWRTKADIGRTILHFVHGTEESPHFDDDVEFWAYYAAYDHVALCQLFGTMMDLPKGFPMYTRDIKQLCDMLGNPRLPEQSNSEHHALEDARWTKQAYDFLMSYLPSAAG